jgi:hypothetical protein
MMRKLRILSWIALYLIMVVKHSFEIKDMATALWEINKQECIITKIKESEDDMKNNKVMVTTNATQGDKVSKHEGRSYSSSI